MQTLLLYVEDVLAVAALETAASSRDAAAAAAAKAAAAARAAAVVLPVLAVTDDDDERLGPSSPASPASPSSLATPPRQGSRSPRVRRRVDSTVLSPSFLPFADRLMAGLFDCVLHPLLLFTLAAGELWC